ncbi:hypothetical protein ARMSODRAFT_1025081 [Armillaria solidipes]|uniref:Uncharacterized protein n=1 Tax=Armillaria solidipes TaxID=1076256 RepID=A0A2H3ATT4_9AGAR|nr:hypothetical protein ARMSODRAFT_1025081 [Armillaria solidipes]
MESRTIPAYNESESLENAWTALVNSTYPFMRASFLMYPRAGLGRKKWRPTWNQFMTEPLPAEDRPRSTSGYVGRDDKADEDWFKGLCIEKGHVRGLDVELAEEGDRRGELVVEDVDGMQHTFAVRATHQIPITEDTYTLLGQCAVLDDDGIRRQFWAVGQRLPSRRFEKVSVVMIDDQEDIERPKGLGITARSRNILV